MNSVCVIVKWSSKSSHTQKRYIYFFQSQSWGGDFSTIRGKKLNVLPCYGLLLLRHFRNQRLVWFKALVNNSFSHSLFYEHRRTWSPNSGKQRSPERNSQFVCKTHVNSTKMEICFWKSEKRNAMTVQINGETFNKSFWNRIGNKFSKLLLTRNYSPTMTILYSPKSLFIYFILLYQF